jgi:hypothetical protein
MARVAVLWCCTDSKRVGSMFENRPLTWVELRGFEPLTPSMRRRVRRSLEWSVHG